MAEDEDDSAVAPEGDLDGSLGDAERIEDPEGGDKRV